MRFGHWGYAGMGWGMLLFWALLIVGVIALVRGLTRTSDRSTTQPPEDQSALDILAQRYARGEIDQAEFEQKRRDLGAL